MASRTRDARVVEAVACEACGAARGAPCRNPIRHDARRGSEDRRAQPHRPHDERRQAWARLRGPASDRAVVAGAVERALAESLDLGQIGPELAELVDVFVDDVLSRHRPRRPAR